MWPTNLIKFIKAHETNLLIVTPVESNAMKRNAELETLSIIWDRIFHSLKFKALNHPINPFSFLWITKFKSPFNISAELAQWLDIPLSSLQSGTLQHINRAQQSHHIKNLGRIARKILLVLGLVEFLQVDLWPERL